MDEEAVRQSEAPVSVQPWPSEDPLLIFAILSSLVIWVLGLVTIIGVLYGVMLMIFFFVTHLIFVARVRGSGVLVGPDQFPQLYEAVQRIAGRFGLDPPPEVYVMQAGGTCTLLVVLFAVERPERVGAGCAPGGNVAGGCGNQGERQRDRTDDRGIVRADAVQQAGKHAAEGECRTDAGHQTGQHGTHSLGDDHPPHAGGTGTERHADPDLTAAPRHRPRDHAVDADAGQRQR